MGCADFSATKLGMNTFEFLITDEKIRAHVLNDDPWFFTDVLFIVKSRSKVIVMEPRSLLTYCDFYSTMRALYT